MFLAMTSSTVWAERAAGKARGANRAGATRRTMESSLFGGVSICRKGDRIAGERLESASHPAVITDEKEAVAGVFPSPRPSPGGRGSTRAGAALRARRD